MTLDHAIAKALSGAEVLRQKATVPFTPNAEVVRLIEQSKAIEHVCAVARQHLAPEPSRMLADARALPSEHVREWLAGEEVRTTHGKNGVPPLPVVTGHAAQLMDATMAALALPKRGEPQS